MTVKELIGVLEEWPDGESVYLASDADGNNFAPIDEVDCVAEGKSLVIWPTHVRMDRDELP